LQPGGHRFEPGILHQPSLMNVAKGVPPKLPQAAKADDSKLKFIGRACIDARDDRRIESSGERK
jgi:hypothetical protein